MENINGNDPIMPTEELLIDGEIGNLKGGLTKREYFAAMAMQGLLCNYQVHEDYVNNKYPYVADKAVAMADHLIQELNK